MTKSRQKNKKSNLNEGDIKILNLLCEGFSRKDIAEMVGLSISTINHYMETNGDSSIVEKLEAINSNHAIHRYTKIIEFIKHIRKDIRFLYQTRLEGRPLSAINLALNLEIEIKSIMNRLGEPFEEELLCLLAEVYYEQAMVYIETETHHTVLKHSLPIIIKIQNITDKFHNNKLLGLLDVCYGAAHSVARNHNEAISFSLKAMDNIDSLGDKLFVLRLLMEGYGSLGNKDRCISTEKDIEKLINNNELPLEKICQAYEGIARSYGKLNIYNNHICNMLNKSIMIFNQIPSSEFVPLRYIQISRTFLELQKKFDIANNISFVDNPEGSLLLAKTFGYNRHHNQMQICL